MNDTLTLLTTLFQSVQYCQTKIRDCMDAASQESLLRMLALHAEEADALESEIRAKAQQLGLYFDGLPPISHLLSIGLTRIKLHFRNTDSFIAELLIRTVTNSMIQIQKKCNSLQAEYDPHAELLVQRFLGYASATIRNMREYL